MVSHIHISPNSNNPRNRPISKITIHHVAGDLSVEAIGNVFAPVSRQASSNYGIGSDGRVGMYVEERNRAWTSSNAANDHQAVTIEVANNGGRPEWTVSDKAFETLIDLCVCICRRNNIPRLVYDGTPNGNLTRHNMFSNTDCPGSFLQSRFSMICRLVNDKLKAGQLKSAVNININPSFFSIPAELTDGSWLMALQDGTKIRVRDVLETMGFGVGWDGESNTIIATKKYDYFLLQ